MVVIQAEFEKGFFDQLFLDIKYYGIKRVEKAYLNQGWHPSFVKCAIRKICRERGW